MTYYISSTTGDDTNSGTDKEHPWAHAPGMATATGNPAKYAPPSGNCSAYSGICSASCGGNSTRLHAASINSSQFDDCSAGQICCVAKTWLSSHNYLLSQPGDTFIFKGCDVWTAEHYPWRIAEPHFAINTGSYYGAALDYLGTGRNEASIWLLGDDDTTWFNSEKCPGGWERPVLDACKVEAPPAPSPHHPGEFMTSCAGSNLVTFTDGALLWFPIKNVVFSGFDIRNIYVPNRSGYTARVYDGRQETAWVTFRNNYIHAWYADPPVEVHVTVAQDSPIVTVVSGDASGIQDGMPFQIAGVYRVFPATNNGPIVANWDSSARTFTATDGSGNIRHSCMTGGVANSQGQTCSDGGYDCSRAPGCLLVGGSQAMLLSPIQGYPNGRDVTFENNVVDGRDSNLVQDETMLGGGTTKCAAAGWGECMGVNGGLFQGPQVVRNNVFRDTTSWYLGGVKDFVGNYLLGPHRNDINTTAHDNIMESLGDDGFGAVVANNVMIGAKAGMAIALNPRTKHTSTAATTEGSAILHFPSDPAEACGDANCEMYAGWALKVVGGGPNGADLDTYILSIDGNDVTLEDPVAMTSSSATILTGGINPSYAFNNVFSDGPQLGDVFQIYSWGDRFGSVYIFNNTVEGGPDPLGYSPGSYPLSFGSGCPAEMEHCEFRNNLLVACSGDGQGSAQCDQPRPFAHSCGDNCVEHANVGQALNQATAQGTTWNQAPYALFPNTQSPVLGAGDNLTARCAQPRLAELCYDASYAVGYDEVRHRVIAPGRTVTARPTTGPWDVGAYQRTASH